MTDQPTRYSTPAGLEEWVARIDRAGVPVLQQTVSALHRLRADEDNVGAQSIAAIVLDDPLMTIKVLSHVARFRSKRVEIDVLSVSTAVQLMGVPPFLNTFSSLTTVEDCLTGWPAACVGVQTVVQRSYRAARLALGFAVHRADGEAELLHEAALIHDFVELLVWCHAPALALKLTHDAAADENHRRAFHERQTLGVQLNDLEQALMTRWGLPQLLANATDDRRAASPRVNTVLLATRLARHAEAGLDNPKLFDDYEAVGALLGITPVVAQRKTLDLLGADV